MKSKKIVSLFALAAFAVVWIGGGVVGRLLLPDYSSAVEIVAFLLALVAAHLIWRLNVARTAV